MAIAVEDLLRCKFQRYMHADGSDRQGKFFLDIARCVEHPRITRDVKTWRRPKVPQVTTWHLDGIPAGTIDQVVEAFNAAPLPPTSPVERAALLTVVGDDWTEQQGDMPIKLRSLTEKGLIEWRDDPGTKTHCRRTDSGRQVLAANYAGPGA